MVDSCHPTEAEPEPPAAAKMIQTIIDSAARILLVEDNEINQKLALNILSRNGCQTTVANHGGEALQALETDDYDCVLMDVQMPEMDGFEATKRIRDRTSSVKNPEIPIIAMTAHAMKGDMERCRQAGMNDYLAKPIDPQELIEKIARWIA
jgi:CheY-like chemotaxis protein